MSDVLIRDLPEEVLGAIDAHAARLGLSRNEYLRRELAKVAQRSGSAVSATDLRRFGDTFADLTDRKLMDQAWS